MDAHSIEIVIIWLMIEVPKYTCRDAGTAALYDFYILLLAT